MVARLRALTSVLWVLSSHLSRNNITISLLQNMYVLIRPSIT
jgi:hypothetical protein